jgi:uncharacterized membrane protein
VDGVTDALEGLAGSPGPLHGELAWLAQALEWASAGIDMAAIAIMLIGAVRFILGFVAAEVRRDADARLLGIDRHRMELGRYILAALELLIVSDIIHTALSLELSDLLFLGLLVLIRSVISFFLDREIRDIREELGGAER